MFHLDQTNKNNDRNGIIKDKLCYKRLTYDYEWLHHALV